MATRIAWLLNFDATDELGSAAGYVTARLAPERTREITKLFLDLVTPDDVTISDGPCDTRVDAVQAFCPTPSALTRIAAQGYAPPPAPAIDVLQRVSDRAFCAGLGHGLAGAAFVRDMPALLTHLQTPSWSGTHVIKRAFSFAGREQRRVQGSVLDDSTRGFCERSFALGQGLQVEPWVQRRYDVSLHGFLTRGGALLLGEPRAQRCDAMGRFLGMQADAPDLHDDEYGALVGELRRVGTALTNAGYFGPFGIDGFRYVGPEGQDAFNPRCEVNPRFTMGYPRALLLRGLQAE